MMTMIFVMSFSGTVAIFLTAIVMLIRSLIKRYHRARYVALIQEWMETGDEETHARAIKEYMKT